MYKRQVKTRGKGDVYWSMTEFGTDCSGECWVQCWNHLVVDMNASAMLPRGAAVVGAMVWTKEWGSFLGYKNLGPALSLLVHARVSVEH